MNLLFYRPVVLFSLVCILSSRFINGFHGNTPDAFKVLSDFIDRNSNQETDDVTGKKLTKRDVPKQEKTPFAEDDIGLKNTKELNLPSVVKAKSPFKRDEIDDSQILTNDFETKSSFKSEDGNDRFKLLTKQKKTERYNVNKVEGNENEAETPLEIDDDVIFKRLRLPRFDKVKVNESFNTVLPGDVEANVKVLSVSPFIFGKCCHTSNCMLVKDHL